MSEGSEKEYPTQIFSYSKGKQNFGYYEYKI
jgi:hypothetical protein